MAKRKTPPRRQIGSRPDGNAAASVPFERLSDIPSKQPRGAKVRFECAPLEVRQVAIDVYNVWKSLCEPGNKLALDQRMSHTIGPALLIAEALIRYGIQHVDYVRLYIHQRFKTISSKLIAGASVDDPEFSSAFWLSRFCTTANRKDLELILARKCGEDEMQAIRAEESKINPLETLFHTLGYTESLIGANVQERGFGPLSAKWLLIDIGNFEPYTAVLIFPRDDRILAHFGAAARAHVFGNTGLIQAIRELPAYRIFNDIDVRAFLHFIETGYKMN